MTEDPQQGIDLEGLLPGPLSDFPAAGEPEFPGLRVLEPGAELGGFRLVRLLGQGGMGQVWEVEQLDLGGRRAALKVIRPDKVGEVFSAYFEREARAAGRLSHPGIVSVYGFGQADGLAWLSMELVEGGHTLRETLDALAKRDVLPPDHDRRAARFIAEVAEAVAAAHAQGVIHRDLKPRNLLIGPDHRPRVSDFGLARLVDEDAISRTGEPIGTLAYMSPEQVAAVSTDIDHRTDVFSLGVVLYEMLTLTRPFRGDTEQQIAYQITQLDPPRLQAVRSRIPRDLAVICECALEKDPERRYATMDEFAADLRRFLAGEGIVARPPGRVDRLWKWARRHPAKSATATLGTASLLALSALLAVVLNTNAELQAKTREERLRSEELELVSRFQGQMLDRLDGRELGELIVRLQRDSLAGSLAEEGADGVETESETRALVLLQARIDSAEVATRLLEEAFLEGAVAALEQDFTDRPVIEARLRRVVGNLYRRFGMHAEGVENLERAVRLLESVPGVDPVPTLRVKAAYGQGLVELGRFEEAEVVLRGALRERESIEPVPVDLVAIDTALGTLHYGRDEPEAALARHQAALAAYESELGSGSPECLGALQNIGTTLMRLDRYEEAEEALRRALEGHRAIDPEGASYRSALYNFGGYAFNAHDFDTSETMHRECLRLRERALGRQHPDTIASAVALSGVLLKQDELDEAETQARTGVEGARARWGSEHPKTLEAINNLASVLQYAGELEEAEALFLEALAGCEARLRRDHRLRRVVASNLAANFAKQGKLDEAAPYVLENLKILEEVTERPNASLVLARGNYGALLRMLGRLDEAETYTLSAAEAARTLEPYSLELDLLCSTEHATVLRGLGRHDDSEPVTRHMLEIARSGLPPGKESALGTYFCIHADDLWRRGLFERAVEVLEEGEDLVAERLDDDASARAELYEEFVELHTAWHEAQPAGGHEVAAKKWRSRLEPLVPESAR